MKRFFLVSFAVLLSASSLLAFVPDASAESIYDGSYNTTDQLELQNDINSCDLLSMTFADAVLIIQNEDNWLDGDYNIGMEMYDAAAAGQMAFSTSVRYVNVDIGQFYSEIRMSFSPLNSSLTWTETEVSTNSQEYSITISSTNNPNCVPEVIGGNSFTSRTISTPFPSLWSNGQAATLNYFAQGFNANYPVDYEGELIQGELPDEGAKESFEPIYNWKVSPTGELQVTYTKNLPYFLTGVGYLVIEQLNEDWTLDQNLTSIEVNPAGWLDEKYALPAAGFYMFRVDYSQQFDAPPWPIQDGDYKVEQVWVQFYWDGESAMSGSTAGCGSSICNDQRTEKNPVADLFTSLDSIETFGLQQILIAPINFIATLPAKAGNCQPIPLTLMGTTVNLECLKPRYEAWNADVMAMWQVVVNATVLYVIGTKIFSVIKNASSPNKDQIEVAQL